MLGGTNPAGRRTVSVCLVARGHEGLHPGRAAAGRPRLLQPRAGLAAAGHNRGRALREGRAHKARLEPDLGPARSGAPGQKRMSSLYTSSSRSWYSCSERAEP